MCKEICPTLRAERHGLKVMQVAQIYGTENEPNPQAGRIYSDEGISPCLDSMRGGQQTAKDNMQTGVDPREDAEEAERQTHQR